MPPRDTVMAIVSRKAISDPALSWFREARFGMFVHFGLYALLRRGEWVQYHENIPRREYEKLRRRFNPARFDADAWVTLAEEAGCKYINLTAKHHDGFCLFDSALTDFKITNTPFGRDLIAELVDACHRRGMRIVFYYSQPDWRHPSYVHLPGAFKDLDDPPPDQAPDWPRYLEYYHGQVEELCTNYGRIDGIWFDGSHKSEETWQGRKVYRLIKKLQPGALVNDRARRGDIFTPERRLPEDLTGYMFEACQSICQQHWGYSEGTPQFSVPNLVENLVRVVGKGGNFLLNVGPAPDGTIPEWQAERLRAVGRWLEAHGKAVYATEAGAIDTGSDDILATRRGGAVNLLLCRWPDADRIVVPGIKSRPRSARLSASDHKLQTRCTDEGLLITGLPMLPPDPCANVIRLQFGARPRLTLRKPAEPTPPTIRLSDRGRTVLSVADASPSGLSVKGGRLHVVRTGGRPAAKVSGWMVPDQRLTWRVEAPRAGAFEVRIRLACARPYHGSTYVVKSGRNAVTGVVKPTPSPTAFRWQTAGEIRLPAGESKLILRPVHMPYGYLFADVAELALTRA